MNFAGSGHAQVQFLEMLKIAMAQGLTFTDLVMPAFSQNGFTTSATMIANNRVVINAVRAIGAKVFLTTDYGVPGYTGAREAGRQARITEANCLAAEGTVSLVDTDAVITDYSTGVATGIKPAYSRLETHCSSTITAS